jgi:hypothetical protein
MSGKPIAGHPRRRRLLAEGVKKLNLISMGITRLLMPSGPLANVFVVYLDFVLGFDCTERFVAAGNDLIAFFRPERTSISV